MSCSAVNCRTRKSERPELLFFRFPLDQELRRKWVVAMKREKMKGEDKPWEPSEHTRLCSLHFRPEEIDHSRIYRKLNRGAIPSIFSWPDDSKKAQKRPAPRTLPPIVFVSKMPEKRQKRYQKETPTVPLETEDNFEEVVHVDLNNVPLCERLAAIEKIIDNSNVPHNQHIDLREEMIENVYTFPNQPTNIKEEIIEDIYAPQNDHIDFDEKVVDLTNLKEEIIEDVYMPHQSTDLKKEMIEDVCSSPNQPTDLKEEIIEDVFAPENHHSQPTDFKEIIEDVCFSQNQPTDLKEEIIEDVFAPENHHSQPTDFKEIIEDVYVPHQSPDSKEEIIIEDVFGPQNSLSPQTDLKEEIIEEIYFPQNQRKNSKEKIIETVYVPRSEQIDVTERILEEVYVPQNQQTDFQEEIIEDVYMPQNQRINVEDIETVYLPGHEGMDSTEQIFVIEDVHMPQNDRIHPELKTQFEKEREQNEQSLGLKSDEIGWLKNMVHKNSELTLCQSQKLKRLNGSKTYFRRKLSAMNRLLEELSSLE